MRRLDRIEILDQPRLPLRRLAGEEAVEIVEADTLAGRPERERTHRGRLGGRRVVPLAEGGGVVAVIAEHLGDRRGCPRDDAGIAVPVDGALGDGARADALMIAPGQQRGAGRRADRSGVEGVVADARPRRGATRSACGPDRRTYPATPKPTSSSMMIRMLGASFGKRLSAGSGTSLDSCKRRPCDARARLGGNGRIEPSACGEVCATRTAAPRGTGRPQSACRRVSRWRMISSVRSGCVVA